MPYRTLGHTGERVSAIGFGLRMMRHAIDQGITFIDNSWDYNDGASEMRVGKALREGGRRDNLFLMTRIDGRSRQEATRQLDESLKRFQTDHIDLVQHHVMIRFDDPHRIFDEDGANAAIVEARGAGKVRYIGFTFHKDPQIHLYLLEVARAHGFAFDTVQMESAAADGFFELFKTTSLFDSTATHPEWLGEETERVRDMTLA